MKIKEWVNYYKKEIICSITMLIIVILIVAYFIFVTAVTIQSIEDGTIRQGVVDIGRGIKTIIEDINKD